MAVLSGEQQSPRGFSALVPLYYFVLPTKTAMLRRLPTPRYASLSPLVFLFLVVIYFWSYSIQKRINFDLPSPSWIPIPLLLLHCPRLWPKQRGSLGGFWCLPAGYVRPESIPSLINFRHLFHNIPRIYIFDLSKIIETQKLLKTWLFQEWS